MTTLKLNSGYEIPIVGLGTWQSKPGEVQSAVKHGLKVGYRHLDCAAVYGNEREVGEGLRAAIDKGLVGRREDVFVTGKLWNKDHRPEDVEPACKKTIQDLGVGYLDLYLMHWPTGLRRGDDLFPRNEDGTLIFDDIHPTETWLAMERLVEKKLVRSIGVSNFNSKQIQDILDRGKIKPVTNQVECHPYLNQKKLLEFCRQRDITITGYSPLGSPTRPWGTGKGEPNLLEDEKLGAIAKKHGKSVAQVLIRYQVQRGVITIPKSVTRSRIEENFNVFDFELGDDDVERIDSLDRNGRVVVPKDGEGRYRDRDHPHFPFHQEF